MTEYKLRIEVEGDEPLKCDSCGFPAPTGEFDWDPPHTQKRDRPKRLLCRFCAETMAGRYTAYPESDAGWLRAEVWRAAANVFNMLTRP